MTKPDPLSASALLVQEVRESVDHLAAKQAEYDRAIDRAHVDDDDQDYRDRLAREVDVSTHALLLAVRDATLKAERESLLALTPEAVVEAAAKAMAAHDENGHDFWDEMSEDGERADYRARVRAALPVLLGPEVARREQAERTMAELARKTNVAEMAREQAEAERDAARLENEEGTRICIETDQRYGAEVSRREAAEAERDQWKRSAEEQLDARLLNAQRFAAAEAEAKRLRGALEFYADDLANYNDFAPGHWHQTDEGPEFTEDNGRIARAALGGTNG